MTKTLQSTRWAAAWLGWTGLALALLAGGAAPLSADDALTLRVNDAIGAPGGLVAIVVRTYASRPIGQGQICLAAARAGGSGGADGPFAALEGFEVFARRGDVISLVEIEPAAGGQNLILQFSSDSAAVNRRDGPLAVVYLRLRDTVRPGQRFRIGVDAANTLLFGADGGVIELEGRQGSLLVRGTADRLRVGAEGDRVSPGEIAELGVETFEPFLVARGQVALRYDPDAAAGAPVVRMDRRHGKRRFSVDRSTPGLVVVTFRSPDGSLNRVPGQLVTIRLPTSPGARPGSRSRVRLDRSLTWLEDLEGDLLPVRLVADALRFE